MNTLVELQVDHINHNGLDNRRANLRNVTRIQNQRNQLPQIGGTSQYKGVCWDKANRKWMAQFTIRGRRYYLGRFISEIEAGKAYDRAARKHFGEFALCNFEEGLCPVG